MYTNNTTKQTATAALVTAKTEQINDQIQKRQNLGTNFLEFRGLKKVGNKCFFL